MIRKSNSLCFIRKVYPCDLFLKTLLHLSFILQLYTLYLIHNLHSLYQFSENFNIFFSFASSTVCFSLQQGSRFLIVLPKPPILSAYISIASSAFCICGRDLDNFDSQNKDCNFFYYIDLIWANNHLKMKYTNYFIKVLQNLNIITK